MKSHVSNNVTTVFVGITMIVLFVEVESPIPSLDMFVSSHREPNMPAHFSTAINRPSTSATIPSFSSRFFNSDPASRVNRWHPSPDDLKSDDSKTTSPISSKLNDLLSPDTFSKANPFQYLIHETSKLPSSEMVELKRELDSRLKTNRIPESFMPYACALRSIILVQLNLLNAKRYFKLIQNHRDSSDAPPEVSSPSPLFASGLFSFDMFSDPDFPIQLLNKFTQYSKSDLLNLMSQLKNFSDISHKWKNVPYVWWLYKRYAEILSTFLQQLDDLKRDMAEIQRISIHVSPESE